MPSPLTTAYAVAHELALQITDSHHQNFELQQQANQSSQSLLSVNDAISNGLAVSNIWLESCDKEVEKWQWMKRHYPNESATCDKMITGWQRTKQRLINQQHE